MTIPEQLEKVKGIMGLYALFDEFENCLYVGKADDLSKRLGTHLKRRDDVAEIAIANLSSKVADLDYESTKAFLRFHEALWIKRFNPIENIMRPKITDKYFRGLPLQTQRKILDDIPKLLSN